MKEGEEGRCEESGARDGDDLEVGALTLQFIVSSFFQCEKRGGWSCSSLMRWFTLIGDLILRPKEEAVLGLGSKLVIEGMALDREGRDGGRDGEEEVLGGLLFVGLGLDGIGLLSVAVVVVEDE